MSGGLLAIRTDWFRKLGEYDMGMEIWGAENMELSLKTWLCGGRLLIAPCSRVGHVFRMRRPYKTKPGMDTALRNAARVARVWFGDYEKYFLRSKPSSSRQDLGDVSEQIKLKESLQCKDMAWFIDNVYPELRPADDRREDL